MTDEPNDRARMLFLSLLSPDQRDQWDREERCQVVSSAGRTWTLRLPPAQRRIIVGPEDDQGVIWCTHLPGSWSPGPIRCYTDYPVYDSLIAILLTLRTDERRLRKNTGGLYRGDGELHFTEVGRIRVGYEEADAWDYPV